MLPVQRVNIKVCMLIIRSQILRPDLASEPRFPVMSITIKQAEMVDERCTPKKTWTYILRDFSPKQ